MQACNNGYQRTPSNDREWSRELGDTEYPMVMAIGDEEAKKAEKKRENLLIHAIARFQTNTISKGALSDHFKTAWLALRLFHSPDLATEFEGKKKIYRSPANSTELETWLNRTFEVVIINDTDQNAETVRQATVRVIKQRQDRIELLPTCTIILQHDKKDQIVNGVVILFISHWRCEAGGALALIDRLVDTTVKLVQEGEEGVIAKKIKTFTFNGEEVEKLTPTVEDALMPNSNDSSTISKERVAKRIKRMSDKMSNHLYVAITNTGANAENMPYKIHERVYSKFLTTTLANRCKSENISVTSAIHAAYLCVLYSEITAAKQESISYASIMPAEVRTRINEGQSPLRQQGCWNAALMLFLALDLVPKDDGKLDLSSIAKSLKHQYQIANQKEWLYKDARQTSVQLIEYFTQTIGNAPTNQSTLAFPYFTSLGILDKEVINKSHGDEKANIQINRISTWADSIASGMVMRVWTFDGQLNIQLSSNQAWHEEEQIEKILNCIEIELNKAFDFVITAKEKMIDAF